GDGCSVGVGEGTEDATGGEPAGTSLALGSGDGDGSTGPEVAVGDGGTVATASGLGPGVGDALTSVGAGEFADIAPKTKAGDTAPASIASRAQTTAAIHRGWRSDTRPLTFSCRARAGDAGGGRGASNIDAIGPVNS